jgi:hypothetical protein
MKLTKRGRIVKRILITVIVLAIIYILNYITTPAECRSNDIEQLSQFCIDLRFPN